MSGGGQPCHHIASAADVNVCELSERVCAVQYFFFSPIVKAKIGTYIEDYIVGVCVTSRSYRNHHNCFIFYNC